MGKTQQLPIKCLTPWSGCKVLLEKLIALCVSLIMVIEPLFCFRKKLQPPELQFLFDPFIKLSSNILYLNRLLIINSNFLQKYFSFRLTK